MTVSENKKKANKTWDDKNMLYQTVKVRKELLLEFKEICNRRGDRVNTVLKTAIEDYVEKYREVSE